MWKSNAKPTPGNVRKRIAAAIEALESAETLAAKHPSLAQPMRAPVHNALGWAREAHRRAGGRN